MGLFSATMLPALLVVSCLVLVSGQTASRRRQCWASSDYGRAKWWPEGSRIDRGRYWFKCYNSKLVPAGCFTPEKRRLNIYQSYDAKGYETTCTLDASTKTLGFKQTNCIKDGRRYPAGAIWNDPRNKYYWQCKKTSEYHLRADQIGCLMDGQRILQDKTMDKGDSWYTCQKKYSGDMEMTVSGCRNAGRRYKVGESWPEDDFIYYCKVKDNKSEKMCIGCQYQNQRLTSGDRYTENDVTYQCDVTQSQHDIRVVGCLQQVGLSAKVNRVIGCRWYEDDVSRKHKYQVECTKTDDEKSAFPKLLGCVYMQNGVERLFMKPDTYTTWYNYRIRGVEGVSCKKFGEKLILNTFHPKDLPYQAAGLRFDIARGKK